MAIPQKVSAFDIPANQTKILNYIRNNGKIDGAASLVNRSDRSLDWYLKKNPLFHSKVRLAKDQFFSGSVDDLQEHWNAHAVEYNADLVAKLLTLVTEGEKIIERNEELIPVKDKKTGEVLLDENDEPVLTLSRVFVKTTTKPTPKYVIDLAIELMTNKFGQPELAKMAPTIVLRFMQFVQRENEGLPGDTLKELFGLASSFDSEFKQEILALTGKTK